MSAEQYARLRVCGAHDAASCAWEAWREAYFEHAQAIAAFRVAVAAPSGKYWDDVKGEMRLHDLPTECNRFDFDGETCGDDAIAWDAAGEARCAYHVDYFKSNC